MYCHPLCDPIVVGKIDNGPTKALLDKTNRKGQSNDVAKSTQNDGKSCNKDTSTEPPSSPM